MIDKRPPGPQSRALDRLAKELSDTLELSFDKRRVAPFLRDTRVIVDRTKRTYRALLESVARHTHATQGIEALFDNFYIIDSALTEILDRWRERETLRIPQALWEGGERKPRAYIVARALARDTGPIDRESVVGFLAAYQRATPLSVRELEVFPDMLRLALIEETLKVMDASRAALGEIESAEQWLKNCLRVVASRDPQQKLAALTTSLFETYRVLPLLFGFHLLQRIAQSGKERELRLVTKRLKLALARQGVSATRLSDSIARAERGRAGTITRAVSGLRWLAQVRWDKISLDLNHVDAMLSRDPARVFLLQTEETRALYRRTVIRIADAVGIHDVEVAREAVRLARLSLEKDPEDEKRGHIGYYLVGKGVAELEATFGYRHRRIEHIRNFILRNNTRVYMGAYGAFTLGFAAFLFSSGMLATDLLVVILLAAAASIVLASEIAGAFVHALLTRLLAPRVLPALDLSTGIGPERRTMVVMPSFFRDEASSQRLISRLETNFIANNDPDIFYAVLMDFPDAHAEALPGDNALVEAFAKRLSDLCERYPAAIPRFSLFYRRRKWNSAEGVFMGWERKRGKLWEFNELLRGSETSYVANADEVLRRFGHIRYVLTIDEDTELARDSAVALIGTIDHPLGRPVVDPIRHIVVDGYGIVEPRAVLRFSEYTRSVFSRLYGGFPGLDLYSSLVSDLQQDLFGEGIFHGKGVYDIDVVRETMSGKIPENTVLSHDHLEGLYARVGVGSGAFVFERFPSGYAEYMRRTHRWVRGDWQVISWIFGGRGRMLELSGKFRIIDNLRRSLLAPAAVILLVSAFALASQPVLMSALVMVALSSGQLVPAFLALMSLVSPRRKFSSFASRAEHAFAELVAVVVKSALFGVFLLHTALINLDAIGRSLWRLFISKRKLLEWQTAHDAALAHEKGVVRSLRSMWLSVSLALIMIATSLGSDGYALTPQLVIAMLWVAAPFLSHLLSIPLARRSLSAEDEAYLREIACRTHWFFWDFATSDSQWLSPDHFQEEPATKRHAHGLGVSPTNLGMYLVSVCAARVLGFITVPDLAERMLRAFQSMEKMERLRGHFFNWYELKYLAPLAPRYVSSVDSANLALSLFAVRGALVEASDAPLLTREMLLGLDAELTILFDAARRGQENERIDRVDRKLFEEVMHAALASRALLRSASDGIISPRTSALAYSGVVHHAVKARNALEELRVRGRSEEHEEVFLAARHVEATAHSYRDVVTTYMRYATTPAVASLGNDNNLRTRYSRFYELTQHVPSVNELASGHVRASLESVGLLEALMLSGLSSVEKEDARRWYDEIGRALGEAEEAARRISPALHNAASDARRYANEMDFAFLYNSERGLFHIGYSANSGRLDEAFYDLFASEANSASIVGIAKRDVPKRHFTYLGRKIVKSANGKALPASWAGSLFEYLGTLLYFDVSLESFWGRAAQRAILAQRAYAQRFRIPWGMGESASAQRDPADNFQYQAFGEPSIGFKRDLSSSLVVAPYTTALALPILPRAAIDNLRALERDGAYGAYGFYDAIDHSQVKSQRPARGVPARIYFSHHQGFIIASIANAIANGWVRRMVSLEPSMSSVTELFEEKMPDTVAVKQLHAVPAPFFRFGERGQALARAPRQYLSVRSKEAHSRFLSNGEYSIHLTSAGAGTSRWGDINITPECDDLLLERDGIFFYLRDTDRPNTWSPTYMPTKIVGEHGGVSFGQHVAVFEKRHDGIESTLQVTLAPDAPVEIRQLVLTNRRSEESAINFGVCVPLSLVRSLDEGKQSNYDRLFIASETFWEGRVTIASRYDPRDRSKRVYVGAYFASAGSLKEFVATRTREAFFGSPQRLDDPPILSDLGRGTTSLPEYTLDTALGFAGSLSLRRGESARLSLVIASGTSREEVIRLLEPYRRYRDIERMVAGADQRGTRLLNALALNPAQAEAFDELASIAIARARQPRSLAGTDARPSVLSLWKTSIPGHHPVILLSVSGIADLPTVRHILLCHSYFLRKGISIDIVILNDHSGGYLKTFEDEIDFLLRMHRDQNPIRRANVYHARTEHLTKAEIAALRSVGAVHLESRKGTLAEMLRAFKRATQLKNDAHKVETVPRVQKKTKRETADRAIKPQPSDDPPLLFANGYGGYDEKRAAYVINVEHDVFPPTPWSNVVANPSISFIANDRGTTFTWAKNAYDNKLTVAYNDPQTDMSAEVVYVRDNETGDIMSPLPVAGIVGGRYRVSHGEGWTEYVTDADGARVTLRMYLSGTQPVKYLTITITNLTAKAKEFSVAGYFELLLGSFVRETRKQFALTVLANGVVVAENEYRNNFLGCRTFVGIVGGVDAYSLSREEFLGRHASLRRPEGLTRGSLSSSPSVTAEPAVTLVRDVHIPGSESRTVTFFLGVSYTDDELRQALKDVALKEGESFAIPAPSDEHESLRPVVELPDQSLALLVNRFLPYQTLASRVHGRGGFYQLGGAFGFRDQLQDALAALWYAPKWARTHILAAAAHQFREGDVLSWWHPHNNFGARTRLSDQHLWLPYVTAQYVRSTGDDAILDEVLPYLQGDMPDIERESVAGVFHEADESGSLYEHCVRAMERALTRGMHGLPLMGTADWNDAMNRVGANGRGESIWLAWFTIANLRNMAVFAEKYGDHARAMRYRDHIAAYEKAINEHGWDGKWYRRAYTDQGVPVGSANGRAFRIDSISQSWAYMVEGPTERNMRALESATEELGVRNGHVPLAWPPLTRSILDLGTISDYPPGVRENGAQYNHAALWLAQTLFASGDADGGMAIVDAVNPLKRSGNNKADVQIYRGEPYVVAAEIYSPPTYPGRAGWTWYTASAGVLYRTVLESLLGVTKVGEWLSFHPSFPSSWNKATLRLTVGHAGYTIRFERKGKGSSARVIVDGVSATDGKVHFIDDAKSHEIIVEIGVSEKD